MVNCSAALAQYTSTTCTNAAGSLPLTGLDLGLAVVIGIALILLGGGLIAAFRRGVD